jgi:O-antigen/teichoic acid export membrane protein
MFRGLIAGGPLAAVAVLTIAALFTTAGSPPVEMYLGIAVCLVPLLLRDYFRARELADLRPAAALLRDGHFAIWALAGIGFLIAMDRVEAAAVYAVVGVAGLVAVASALVKDLRVGGVGLIDVRGAYATSWKHSRWSLIGAVSSWVQGNAYIFVPFLLLGAREVAFLAASRLLMTPVILASQGWANLSRPALSRWMGENRIPEVRSLFLRSSALLTIGIALYTTALALSITAIPVEWIPEDYEGIVPFLALWAVILLVQTLRGNVSSVLQAALAFRGLARVGGAVALLCVVATFASVIIWGSSGAVVALLIAEVVLGCLLLRSLRVELRYV